VNGGDPEEHLIDIIARKFMNDEISFSAIENLREQLCPYASQ
jgi:hypothetical protein